MTEFLTYYFAGMLIIMMVNSLNTSCKRPLKIEVECKGEDCWICKEQEYWNQKYNDNEL